MNTAQKIVDGLDRLISWIVGLLLILALMFGAYAILDTYLVYARAGVDQTLLNWKPRADNLDFSRLQAINPDICGWITVDNTHIDFPVLQGEDNDDYLNRDYAKEYSLGGSIFLDCSNDSGFQDYYSLLYGHHMDGGAMFGDIKRFEEPAYFDSRKTGTLYTPEQVYNLELFAVMHVDAYDSVMFRVPWNVGGEQLIRYVGEHAMYQRGSLDGDRRILAMSTCSLTTTNGRTVLLAWMNPYSGKDESN